MKRTVGRSDGARIAVGVSGTGSNLRALAAAAARGSLGGSIGLVFADRPCEAIEWAREQGIETAVVPGGADDVLAGILDALAPAAVVLAGYMRIVGPRALDGHRGRILNTHPSLLPAFPGAHAIRDALAAGAMVTGATIHLVDEVLDGGPIVAQEAVTVLPGDDEAALRDRIQAVEHRLLPAATAALLAGAIEVRDGRLRVDAARAADAVPPPRRALLSVSDKTGLDALGGGLVRLGFELVSTGGTARFLRDAGWPVTDVAAVTGAAEMLDGRVKTLHPRVHAGILGDRRRPDHRAQLAAAWIAPFELVVVNLYPFAAALQRPGITTDELIEEIDIGGPSLVRAAAKNHASVAIVTDPAWYEALLDRLAAGPLPDGLRASLAVHAFRHTAAYDARIATELPRRLHLGGAAFDTGDGLPEDPLAPFPASLVIGLERVETLRYGENPHQQAARYVRPGSTLERGPFATGAPTLQGKPLSYNNVLDAAAAAAIGRRLRGPGCVIVKHTNPCGAAERATLLEAWADALAGDPVSAYGGVVALTRLVDRAVAEALASIFLEVVVAPGFDEDARAVLASKSNLRLVVDPLLVGAGAEAGGGTAAVDPTGCLRSAGGAVLVSAPDDQPDDPADWRLVTRRAPTAAEQRDLDLAWRLVRGVTSNAIALVRDGRLVGIGSGQTSRVDAARHAVDKARAISGADSVVGAACASDAFFPFPDAVEVVLAAGATAVVQPGGSIRDGEVLAAVEQAGGTMLVTGRRHFRH